MAIVCIYWLHTGVNGHKYREYVGLLRRVSQRICILFVVELGTAVRFMKTSLT
jgi:hypothetical protein